MNQNNNKIVICTGHYRQEKGAKNKYLNVSEWQLCTFFNEALKVELQQYDFNVFAYDNYNLTEKVRHINLLKPLLAVDLHMNAFDMTTQGHLCLYWKTSEKGKRFADCLTLALIHNDSRSNISVYNRGVKGGYFLGKTKCPAIILELCFIDNYADVVVTMCNIKSIVQNIRHGIINANTELIPQPV